MTFSGIFKNLGIELESVKYLQIDAEGYDAEILQLLPWGNNFKPALINFETVLLSSEDVATVSNVLRHAGYIQRALTHQTALWAFSSC